MSKHTRRIRDLPAGAPAGSKTVAMWCEAYHICEATFYNQRKLGIGPRLLRYGRQNIITPQAEAEFIAQHTEPPLVRQEACNDLINRRRR